MQSTSDLMIEREGAVARVIINRPQVRNALSYDLARRLHDAVRELGADSSLRAIVLTGAGNRAFISGADVTEFETRLSTPEGAMEFDGRLEAFAHSLETSSKPVIAMIQGAAIGSGLLVALACDFRIAVDDARFGVPVSRIGLVPCLPDVNRLVRIAGLATAKRLMFTGEIIDAATAKAAGLIDSYVPRTELAVEVDKLTTMLAERAPLSIAAMKGMLANVTTGGATVEDSAAAYQTVYASRDLAEGIAALLEKRKPVFEGS